MEVNLQNFEEKLALFRKSIQNCEFLAFDTEFTGSKLVVEDKPHEFDTFNDKYVKNKAGIEKFTIVQAGLTTYHWSDVKKKYIGRPFNIPIYPRSIVGEGHVLDNDMSQQTSFHANADTVQFLNRHHFDFNMVFHQGLPYTQLSRKQALREKCEQFVLKQFNQKTASSDLKYTQPTQKRFMSQKNQMMFQKHIQAIRNFIEKRNLDLPVAAGRFQEMTLEVGSVLLRQNLSREMHRLYGFDVFEVNFDLDPENTEFSIRKMKTPDKVASSMSIDHKFETQPSSKFVENPETGQVDQVTTKMRAMELEGQIKHEVETLYEYELGFSRIVEIMIKERKPLIGHNMFLDIMFLYQQFIADLPDTLEEFVHNFSFYFPVIYDTKAMAETLGFFTQTTLNAMVNKCQTDKKFQNYLEFEFDMGQGFAKYLQKTALHEAGYDSYITGVCFASFSKQIEIQTFIEYQKIRGRTGGSGVTVSKDQALGQFRTGGTIVNSGENGILSCRIGMDFQVPLPNAKNLVEISNSPLTLGCAVEFENYVMLAMEGQRAFRFDQVGLKTEEVIDHKNVIFIELTQRLTAFEMSNMINAYGDVYVVKDSAHRYFIEFQWVDDIKNPDIKSAQDLVDKITEDQIFGTEQRRNAQGVTVTTPMMTQCMTYANALKFRKSLYGQKS